MFCQQCGIAMADDAGACPTCNTPVLRAAPSRAAAMAGTVKAAYSNGLAALKGFAGDPVGRLPQVYESLGEQRALRIGITYGVVSVLCFLLGGYLLFPFKDGLFERLGVGGVLRGIVFAALPFGCAFVGGLATRKVFGGQGGGKGGDVFVAGAALLPASFAIVLNGILGLGYTGLATAISTLAGCTGVLMLFSGYCRVAKLSERAATLAVPIVVVLTLWVGRGMASSVIESALDASVRGSSGTSSSSGSGWNVNLGFSNDR